MTRRSCIACLACVVGLSMPAIAQVKNSVGAYKKGTANSPAGATRAPAVDRSGRAPARMYGSPVQAVLNKRIELVDWDEQSLQTVVDWLQEQGPINVIVTWRALEAQGVDADTNVSLRMRNATVGQILTEALGQLGEQSSEIRFRAQGSIVKISTRTEFNKRLYTKTYAAHDLTFHVPDFKGPTIDITGQGTGGSGGSGGGGGGFGGGGGGGLGGGGGGLGGGGLGGGGLGGGGLGSIPGLGQGSQNPFSGGGDEGEEEGEEKSLDDQMKAIVELIRTTIEPEQWKENGGQSTITYYERNIVVRAPIEIHELIGGPFVEPD